MKRLKFWSIIMLMVMSLPLMVSCGGDDSEDKKPPQKEVVVEVNDNGIASNGSTCVIIDDNNFYLDFVKYSVEEGHLVVSGYEKDAFKGIANIPSRISFKENTYVVLAIAEEAFANCKNLTFITIPNSVTSIGGGAFDSCSGLTFINFPNSVRSIGNNAFYGCSKLSSVTIPPSVTSIDNSFSSCSGLNSIKVDAGNTTYDSRENCNAIIETRSNTLIAGCKNTVIPNSPPSPSPIV